MCQLRLGWGGPGHLNPDIAWLLEVTHVESCSCAWSSLVCRVTPMTSKAMSSSICHEGEGGREGRLGPGSGDAMGKRGAECYAKELVLWPAPPIQGAVSHCHLSPLFHLPSPFCFPFPILFC